MFVITPALMRGHQAVAAAKELSSLRLSQRGAWSRARRICHRLGPYGDIDLSELRPCVEVLYIQREYRAALARLGLEFEREPALETTWKHLCKFRDPTGW